MKIVHSIVVCALAASLVGCDKKQTTAPPATSASWSPTSGPSEGSVFVVSSTGNILLAGGDGGALFRSADNGAHWTAIHTSVQGGVRAFAISGTTLFAGTD